MPIIVVEGPDEVGKTTLAHRLVDHLIGRGEAAQYLAFPGHEPNTLGAEVYRLHHDYRHATMGPTSALTVQLLHLAAHAQLMEFRILPLMKAGVMVVLDRFWWSLAVYGRYASLAPDVLERMIGIERWLWRDLEPVAIILLARKLPLTGAVSVDEFNALAREYADLASSERQRSRVEIIPEGSMDDTLMEVVRRLESKEVPP